MMNLRTAVALLLLHLPTAQPIRATIDREIHEHFAAWGHEFNDDADTTNEEKQ